MSTSIPSQCRLSVKVKPRAKRDAISLADDGTLMLAVTAPPVDGKANEQVIRVLSKALGISRAAISIVCGQTSKRKVLEITGPNLNTVRRILTQTAERKP